MTMISPTFPLPQTQNNLQFIPYNGPPKPKQNSQRNPSEKVPSNDEYPALDEIQGIGPASTSHGVEVIDLTCNYNIGGNGGGGSGDIGCDNSLSPQNGHQSGGFEQLVSMRTSRGATSDESLGQPAPSVGSSQENAVVIKDSQPGPEINTDGKGCPLEDDIGAQTHDWLEILGISTSDLRDRECSTGMEDAIKYEVVGELESQANRLPRRESTSTPSTPPNGSSMRKIEQSTQEASGYALPKATPHQPQRPMHKAKGQGKFPILVNMSSSSSSSSNGSDDDDSGNHTISLKRKRKRSPPAKRHSRTSNTILKQPPKRAAQSARRKPSHGRPLSNRPSGPKPLSAAQYNGYDTKICYSDDSSDDSSKESGDQIAPPEPVEVDGELEYYVERIEDLRFEKLRLQYEYLVKWTGYDDATWEPAYEFASTAAAEEYHIRNPSQPDPNQPDPNRRDLTHELKRHPWHP